MPKSLLYVPGLALPEAGAPVTDASAFKAKIASVFRAKSLLRPSPSPDEYLVAMVDVLCNKGALPVDCRRQLRWVQLTGMAAVEPVRRLGVAAAPRPPKLERMLGKRADNVLATAPGGVAKPIDVQMIGGEGITACTANEYLGQPKPTASTAGGALVDVKKGDTLYIVGHSNLNGSALTYKYLAMGHAMSDGKGGPGCDASPHSEKRHVDPVALGSLLIDEGLPAGVVFDIAVVACYSGGLADDTLQTVQSFAQRLAGTLGARGYRCRVYGAKGFTSVATVAGRREVHVAGVATKTGERAVKVETAGGTPLADGGGQPFYKRFFRVFG
jgi:hypothetical protein